MFQREILEDNNCYDLFCLTKRREILKDINYYDLFCLMKRREQLNFKIKNLNLPFYFIFSYNFGKKNFF